MNWPTSFTCKGDAEGRNKGSKLNQPVVSKLIEQSPARYLVPSDLCVCLPMLFYAPLSMNTFLRVKRKRRPVTVLDKYKVGAWPMHVIVNSELQPYGDVSPIDTVIIVYTRGEPVPVDGDSE